MTREDLKDYFTDEEWEAYDKAKYTYSGGRHTGKQFITKEYGGFVDRKVVDFWRQAYLRLSDNTEYLFALFLCGDWSIYKGFRASSMLYREILEEWKDEVEIILRSKAMSVVMDKAKTDPKTAQWLVEGKHKIENKGKKRVGRPSKVKEDKINMDVWSTVDTEDVDKILGVN